MKSTPLVEGDPVRITSGVYKGAEGVIEDILPECSTIRVHTSTGNAYAYVEAVSKIVKPMPSRAPKNPLLKK